MVYNGTKNLIPLKKGSQRAKVIGRLGGQRKTKAKTLANLSTQSRKAKCKNCKALCVLKKNYLQEDINQICTVPEARAKAIFFDKPVMSIEILERITHRALLKLTQMAESPRDVKMIIDAAMKEREYIAPSTKKIQVGDTAPLYEYVQDLYSEYEKNKDNDERE